MPNYYNNFHPDYRNRRVSDDRRGLTRDDMSHRLDADNYYNANESLDKIARHFQSLAEEVDRFVDVAVVLMSKERAEGLRRDTLKLMDEFERLRKPR